MNKRLNKTQRNYIIIGLCAILVIMGVGYAAFQSQLKISGTSNIASNFLVKITGIQVSSKSGGAADKPEVTTHTDTTATFGTTLQSPGDSITYNITIANQGSVDAVLKTINKTDTNNSAIIFETSGVNEGDPLNVGEIATMQVTVTYNPDVTSQPTNLESTLKVDLTYEQSEETIIPSNPTTTVGGQEVEVVSSGNGLYADEYEAGKYTYKGANPNNYITFNNETWRIISINSDGTIKIMRDRIVGRMAWNASAINDWTSSSTLNTYLNETYYNSLNSAAQSQIITSDYNIGAVYSYDTSLQNTINDEKSKTWNGKVALITVSEYIRSNSNQNSCGTMNQTYELDSSSCRNTSWIYEGDMNWWTLTPNSQNSMEAYYAYNSIYIFSLQVSDEGGVRPVVTLSADTTLSGSGTQSNPFTIN